MDKHNQEGRLNVRPIRQNEEHDSGQKRQTGAKEELMEAVKAFRRRSRTAVHIPKPKNERKKKPWYKKHDKSNRDDTVSFSFISSMQTQIAICAAIVIAAMTIKSITLPAAQVTSAVIKDAVTMEMEIDEPLGGLKFVQNMFPETVAVLWQHAATDELQAPAYGKVTGKYSISSPGITITADRPDVYACWQGEVKSIVTEETGDLTITVSHMGGLDTVYAKLSQSLVKEGDNVDKGERIGICSEHNGDDKMFLQVRLSGVVVDPTPYLQ